MLKFILILTFHWVSMFENLRSNIRLIVCNNYGRVFLFHYLTISIFPLYLFIFSGPSIVKMSEATNFSQSFVSRRNANDDVIRRTSLRATQRGNINHRVKSQSWVNFINMIAHSLYTCRPWKHKKLLDLTVFFALLGLRE